MRAFGQSGRKKQTGPLQRPPRSVIGVLQLAYFSMRYGSLLGLTSGEFYQKSYPAVFPGSTPKRTLVGYFRHRTGGFLSGLILRRLKSGKGLKQIAPPSSRGWPGQSDAPVVGTPSLDRFLDVRPGKLLIQCPLGELRHFAIRSEAQADELLLSQLRDARAQRLGQQNRQAQPLFQPNHPVLHFERISPNFKDCDQCGHRDHKQQSRMQAGVPQKMDDASDRGDAEPRQYDKVKQRIQAGVIGKSLRLFSCHAEASLRGPASVAEETESGIYC